MAQDTLYILAAPGLAPRFSRPNIYPAWLSYRVTPALTLLRIQGPEAFRGGIMVITGYPEDPRGDPSPLCRVILAECARRNFQGLLLDIDRPSPIYEQLTRQLAHGLTRRGVRLFLPEHLAPHAPGCRVLIPSALSGGSLELRLREAAAQYGADRVVLAVERTAEDFTLPAPDGCGQPLGPDEPEALMRTHHTRSHFSTPLCARYFTYQNGNSLHLVLYDNKETLLKKIACARSCGISRFLLPWDDISPFYQDFLPQ